jgi:hypothetical protein
MRAFTQMYVMLHTRPGQQSMPEGQALCVFSGYTSCQELVTYLTCLALPTPSELHQLKHGESAQNHNPTPPRLYAPLLGPAVP